MAEQHPRNPVHRWASTACVCAMCFSLLSSAANAEIEGLFSDADNALSLEEPGAPEVAPQQRRIVRIDFGQLDTARKEVLAGRPAHLALNLFDGASFRVIVDRTAPTSSGYSLSGRLEGIPFGTMTLVRNGSVVMGKVRTLDAVYTIRSVGAGTYVISRTEPMEFTEGPPLKPVPATSALDSETDARATEEDDGSEIDVFVVWTSAAKSVFGGTRPVRASIDLAVVETNDAYAASGAAQRIRLVGAVEVDYDEPDHIETHLRRLVNPSDGYLDEIHTLRDSYAADLVHLALGGGCGSFGFAGLAFLMDEPSPSFASSAFSASVFCDDFLDGRGLGSRGFAHELGHNMGLQHDRYARYATLNKPYPYSHGYVNKKAFEDGATRGARWRTVMSYNDQCADAGFDCRQLLRFSNPDQRYPDASGHPLGIPGDDASEEVDGPADAVRSLDETHRCELPPQRFALHVSSGARSHDRPGGWRLVFDRCPGRTGLRVYRAKSRTVSFSDIWLEHRRRRQGEVPGGSERGRCARRLDFRRRRNASRAPVRHPRGRECMWANARDPGRDHGLVGKRSL